MEEITFIKKEEVIKYKTSDGVVFDRKDKAEIHEQYLVFKEKVNKLKCVDGAYYCETQEDFDAIVDRENYRHPVWSCSYGESVGRYKPSSHYNKNHFEGPDWYFFRYEYQDEAADDYWVESLSEKKAEWDKFYQQFVV